MALLAFEAGLSVVPPVEDGVKRPMGSWKRFQKTPADRRQIDAWYGPRTGVGLVCGSVSGGLALFEFDDPDVCQRYVEAGQALGLGELIDRVESGCSDKSPGGGTHWYYLCPDDIRGNTKLAERAVPGGIGEDGQPKPESREPLIETRGEGGYSVIAPSYGKVHSTGRPYKILSGSVATIATITADEQRALWDLARTFDQVPAEERPKPTEATGPTPTVVPAKSIGEAGRDHSSRSTRKEGAPLRPGEDYEARVEWDQVLTGWTKLHTDGQTTYWRRPGKSKGWSATTNHLGSGVLIVFSSSTAFETGKTYSKFCAYAILNHQGDFAEATKSLAGQGFGEPLRKREDQPRLKLVKPSDVARNGTPSTNGSPPAAAPDQPAQVEAPKPHVIRNYRSVTSEGKEIKESLTVQEIDADREAACGEGDLMRLRSGDVLFTKGQDGGPVYLDSAPRYFAHLDRRTKIDWAKGGQFVSQERYYEHTRMTTEGWDAIETNPHFPRIEGHYYMGPELPEGDGEHLHRLVDFFAPLTEVDRQLIKAVIATPAWGGGYGKRPAWHITGPDKDPMQGRGLGKSTFPMLVGELYEGITELHASETIADAIPRLLSDSARSSRIIRIDNIKTYNFSDPDLEAFITSPIISGKQLYRGEGRRPNTFTVVLTMNGGTLSKDLAQRCITIKLGRPAMRPQWEEEVRGFIATHRLKILADIGLILTQPGRDIEAKTRWAAWEKGVLSRLEDPIACQAVIAERQEAIDSGNEEKELVAAKFVTELEHRKHDPDDDVVFLTSGTAARWLSKSLRKHFATAKATAFIKGLGIAELTPSKSSGTLGWIWRGSRASQKAHSVRLRDDGEASDSDSNGRNSKESEDASFIQPRSDRQD